MAQVLAWALQTSQISPNLFILVVNTGGGVEVTAFEAKDRLFKDRRSQGQGRSGRDKRRGPRTEFF